MPLLLLQYNVINSLSPSLSLSLSSRVVWVFGGVVDGPIEDITPTYLTEGVLSTLRQADCIANQVLTRHSEKTIILPLSTASLTFAHPYDSSHLPWSHSELLCCMMKKNGDDVNMVL